MTDLYESKPSQNCLRGFLKKTGPSGILSPELLQLDICTGWSVQFGQSDRLPTDESNRPRFVYADFPKKARPVSCHFLRSFLTRLVHSPECPAWAVRPTTSYLMRVGILDWLRLIYDSQGSFHPSELVKHPENDREEAPSRCHWRRRRGTGTNSRVFANEVRLERSVTHQDCPSTDCTSPSLAAPFPPIYYAGNLLCVSKDKPALRVEVLHPNHDHGPGGSLPGQGDRLDLRPDI